METPRFIDTGTTPINRVAEAKHGLKLIFEKFQYERHTFQFIGKNPKTKNLKSHSPVFTYTPQDKQKALKDCLQYNADGCDIYFMVNEGDGVIHPGKRAARSQDSVSCLSKLFIDTDNCPIEKVEGYLRGIGLHYHLKIESSPGRFHLYFFLSPEKKTTENILSWQTIQKVLHRLGDVTLKSPSVLGMDATMHDYSKVLRIPGFVHSKTKTLVKFISASDYLPYNLVDVYNVTHAQDFLDYTLNTYGTYNPSILPDLQGTEIINPGDRFAALQSLSMHLANTVNGEMKPNMEVYESFIRNRLDNADEIYCDKEGNVTEKAKNLFQSALAKISREEKEKIRVITEQAIEFPVLSLSKKAGAKDISSWHLPDEFYLSAPNGFGDVVKQVMDNSLYPCAALAFSTFLTGLSILKAKTHFTPHGSSPALYTLNVAPPGYGKSDPMLLLQNMFASLGIGRLISNDIRSDRGLYAHLSANEGLGLFILDEVAPLLRVIQKEDANSHHVYIARALLQLFSSGVTRGVSFGKISASNTKKGEKEIVLDNPMLALIGYTVPEEFNKLFTIDSVTRGLFQRFIPVVPDLVYVSPNTNANRSYIVNSDLFSIPALAFLNALDIEDSLENKVQETKRKNMSYSPGALFVFDKLSVHYRRKYITIATDVSQSHTAGLYSRVVEQIERVASILSIDEISLTTLEYAVQFIESRHQAVLDSLENTFLMGEGSRNVEKEKIIVESYRKVCQSTGSEVASSNDVYLPIRRQFRGRKPEFNSILFEAIELGIFERIPSQSNYILIKLL